MMQSLKATILVSVVIGITLNCSGQNRTSIWELGGNNFQPQFYCGLDFSNGMADTFRIHRPLAMFVTDASICDTSGKLLFYTNGEYVANRNNDTLLNSGNFNPGYGTDTFYANEGIAYEQGAIAFPKPASQDHYYIAYITFESATGRPSHLSLSEIDMTLDNGLGGIIPGKKNIHLVDDTIIRGRITACLNANGRDWWLVTHEFATDRYYTFLITPDSILGPYSQYIGQTITNDIDGQSAFSPDGNYYATISPYDGKLDIFKFDRCTGIFSDAISYQMSRNPSKYWLGLSFSPDSKFLYVSSYLRIIQFNLKAVDIINSQIVVAKWKTFYSPTSTWFYIMQPALDNKIYLSTWGFDSVIHVIDKPDSLGELCNVLQNHIKLPVDNTTVPNFPNYDLSALGNYLADAGPNDTIVEGESVQLGIPPVAGVKYQWKSNSTLSDTTIAQPIAKPDTTTTYYVTFTDTSTFSSCNVREDTVTVFVKIATGISSQKPKALSQNSFRVLPNPVSKWLNIVYHSNDDALFELYNQFGERVAAISLYHYFKNRMLDVSNLPSEVYNYRIEQRNEMLQSGTVAVIK